MSDNSKINIYINSKNRRSDEPTSNFNVIIPDGLLKVKNNEEFEVINLDNKNITIKNDRLNVVITHQQFNHFDLFTNKYVKHDQKLKDLHSSREFFYDHALHRQMHMHSNALIELIPNIPFFLHFNHF